MTLREFFWCVGLVVATVACRERPDKALGDAITSQIKSSTILDLSTVTSFDWDTVYIVIPYTPEAWAEKEFGAEYSKIEHYEMYLRDRIYLFVFVNSDEIVRVAEVGASVMLFGPRVSRAFRRPEARFRVEPGHNLRSLQPISATR